MNSEPSQGKPAVHPHAVKVEPSLTPTKGWHCSHFYYAFDRQVLNGLSPDQIAQGIQEFEAVFDKDAPHATQRNQISIVSGHKADFSLMIMDPDPLKVDSIHQLLKSTQLGPALQTTYSFVSISEISEYVPTIEQYAEQLKRDGLEDGTENFNARLQAYESRLPKMNRQRLTPDFPLPEWPATCFYPMNKWRVVGANWFDLPFSARRELMAEHARSGMKFIGKVTQLITVSVGLDDWEWGVTLWAKNPQFLKDIVYTMRFDKASAKYAEFGPFYTSYICEPADVLKHCRIGV